MLGGINVKISTEAMCLGVLLDSALTFAPHVWHLSGKSFCHLRQMNTVRKSLMEDAATTMVHASVTSRVDYCNSAHCVSMATVQSLQNMPTLQLKSYCISRSSTTSPLTFEVDYIGCPYSRELNTKCVSWCTSVCIKLHQHTSLNCAHRCLNQPIVDTSVPLHVVTL